MVFRYFPACLNLCSVLSLMVSVPEWYCSWVSALLSPSSTCRLSVRLLFVGCWTSQQHAHVTQGGFCSDICLCCHTEIEVAYQTFHLTQSQYTDTGPASPSADLIKRGVIQGSHWSTKLVKSLDWLSLEKDPRCKLGIELRSAALEADASPLGQQDVFQLGRKKFQAWSPLFV